MRLVANDRKFDVDYDGFFVFENRSIFMGDIPCFHCRFKYCQDRIFWGIFTMDSAIYFGVYSPWVPPFISEYVHHGLPHIFWGIFTMDSAMYFGLRSPGNPPCILGYFHLRMHHTFQAIFTIECAICFSYFPTECTPPS